MIARLGLVVLAASLATAGCDRGERAPDGNASPPTFVERTVAPRRTSPGAPPPVLVVMHGIGANEDDLVPVATALDPRLLVVSLRAPHPYHQGWAWFDVEWHADGTIVPDVAQARATLADLVRWLEVAPSRLGGDPHRVFLLGFSQGAIMSLGVLRTAPERLAGVVALSGRSFDALFAATASAPALARVPVFVAHGTEDRLLGIESGRAIRDALQPLVRDFTYREFPIAHTIAPAEIAAVAAWLTERLDR